MSYPRWTALTCLAAVGLLALPATQTTAQAQQGVIPGRYIVVVNPLASPAVVANRHGLAPDAVWNRALNGFAAAVPGARLPGLLADPAVDWVEPDREVKLIEPLDAPRMDIQLHDSTSETLPTGIDRIGADLNTPSDSEGLQVGVAIIDTGIDLDHPDLNVTLGVSYVKGNNTEPWQKVRRCSFLGRRRS